MAKRRQSHTINSDTDTPDLPIPGSVEEALEEEAKIIEQYAAKSRLTGGDVDADWQDAADVGDEAVGGHAPTPDQDDVDAIGRALGIELPDNQELQTHDEILEKRDKERWELDRRSEEEESETEEPD